jgi:hypothetical protein
MTQWDYQALLAPLGLKQKPGEMGRTVSQCLALVAMAPVAMVPISFISDFSQPLMVSINKQDLEALSGRSGRELLPKKIRASKGSN